MEILEIRGKVNTALCYVKVIEDEAIEQVRRMCDYPLTEGSRIRIMPDVHSGKGCTIGTTMTITDKVVPNIVGVDIGCGMYTIDLGKQVAELYQKLAINLDRGYGDYLEKRDEIIRTFLRDRKCPFCVIFVVYLYSETKEICSDRTKKRVIFLRCFM